MADNGAPDGGQAKPTALQIAHQAKGRIRFRLRESLPRDALTALITRISEIPGVIHVVARPNTGSVIIELDGDGEAVLERIKADEIGVVLPHVPPPPLGQLAQFGMMKMDAELGKRTDGMLDFRTALAAILIVIALGQLMRGNLAGPTTTLLMSAFSLLDKTSHS